MLPKNWSSYLAGFIIIGGGLWVLYSSLIVLLEVEKALQPMNLPQEFRDNFNIIKLCVFFGPWLSIAVLGLWILRGKEETAEDLRDRAYKMELAAGEQDFIVGNRGSYRSTPPVNRPSLPRHL